MVALDRQLLARDYRIRRKADFDNIFRTTQPLYHALLALRAAPNQLGHSRAGIVCGRQVGGAVVRNRARRRLREALRTVLPVVPPGWDILLVIRPAAGEATVGQFLNALDELLRRRGLAAEARNE